MAKTPIRIILVDDHDMVRQSWKLLLQTNPAFELIGDCSNGLTAIEETLLHGPDILLVDINMSPISGFHVTEEVLKQNPAVKIIGLSVHIQPGYAQRMLALGGKGYLTKTSTLEEIHYGITKVHEGEIYICEEVKRNMESEKEV